MNNYKVIKRIEDGWEDTADVGDILYVENYEGRCALFKAGKAICDVGSVYETHHCERMDNEEID
jgi:hypothetical protein